MSALFDTIADRLRGIGRLVRFGLVGAGVSALYTLITIALIQTRWIGDPTLAGAIAFCLSIPVSFLGHRRVTYADAAQDPGQWRRFGLIAVSSFLVSTGAIKGVDLWGKPYWIALAIIWILVPATNYIMNAIWVFRVSGLFTLPGDVPDETSPKQGAP